MTLTKPIMQAVMHQAYGEPEAGGCMGPIAVQIAKADGAHVTAVDHAEKLPMLRSLGADLVIDYRREDYLKNGQAARRDGDLPRTARVRHTHAHCRQTFSLGEVPAALRWMQEGHTLGRAIITP